MKIESEFHINKKKQQQQEQQQLNEVYIEKKKHQIYWKRGKLQSNNFEKKR